MRRAKIVCTLGPPTQSRNALELLVKKGMNVARLNFSHGDHAFHGSMIKKIRMIEKKTKRHVAILQDLQGIKIRVGRLDSGKVHLEKGRQIEIAAGPDTGNDKRIYIDFPWIVRDAKPGDIVLLDDGLIQLEVRKKTGSTITAVVVEGGALREHKGVNLPRMKVSAPFFTKKDREDIEFGIKSGVDYVALSFVRSAKDVRTVKKWLTEKGLSVPLIAKIEKEEAINDIDAILDETDGIMVARGDLGVEMPLEEVPMAQKMLIARANEKRKIVITATQMLESMIENPKPTRAEASDVANAVLDGADAVMLSAETSIGRYPASVVRTMDNIIRRAEMRKHDHLGIKQVPAEVRENVFDAVARAACVLARQVNAAAIVPITHSGATAIRISKYRPEARIVTVTGQERILRQLNLVWGVHGIESQDFIHNQDTAFKKIIERLKAEKYIEKGDFVVFTAGLPLLEKGTTDTVHVEQVD